MPIFDFDPDGKQNVTLESTVQTIQIPAGKGAFLSASFDAAFEQAVVLFVNGNRRPEELGSFNRPTFTVIGEQGAQQTLAVVGWHKRGGPDGSLPWVPSRGRIEGNFVAAFDDSAEDGDFNDCRVKVLID
jgi:hypothetical protein